MLLQRTQAATSQAKCRSIAIFHGGLAGSNRLPKLKGPKVFEAPSESIAVTVTERTPTVSDARTAVGPTQQDAKANVAGTFSYYPAAGWKPIVGMHTMTATFTPADTTDYVGGKLVTVTLTVNAAP